MLQAHQGQEGVTEVASGHRCQGGRVTAGLSLAVGLCGGKKGFELPLLACHLS